MSEEITIQAGMLLSVIAVVPEPGKGSLIYIESGPMLDAQTPDTQTRLLTDVVRLIQTRLGEVLVETIEQELAGSPATTDQGTASGAP